jgi:biopolymer transport protein ExbB/TolQ
MLFSADQSKISLAIALLYVVGTIHCGRRSILVSTQLRIASQTELLITSQAGKFRVVDSKVQVGNQYLPEGYAAQYLWDAIKAMTDGQVAEDRGAVNNTLAEIFSAKLKGAHEFGWFIADIMVKLGLLGTIVGFIFMLGSVTETTNLDINTMQRILKEMSRGMGTALYTTLAGLTGSVLLTVQYRLLDRGTDELIEKTVYLAEVHVLPQVQKAS